MKKLLTLALIGVFSTMSLTSCSNTERDEPINQTYQEKTPDFKTSAREIKDPVEQEIYDEIVESLQNVGYGVEFEYGGRWKLLCHSDWFSSVGNACFSTPKGNYNIHWQPLYHNSMPELAPSAEFNPIIYTGSWGCTC